MKRLLISLAIFVCLLVIAAVIMEFTATDLQQKMRYARTRDVFQYSKERVVFDPVLGYRLTPNLDVAFSNAEFSTTVRTNAVGFRDDDASLSNPDVLFLGDSYVFGWGVERADGVEKQYEQRYGKKVLNMGVPGYSSIQEMLMLFKWSKSAPVTGKQVFLFVTANDFIDNENTAFGAFPYFMEQDGRFIVHQSTTESFGQWQETVDKWTIHAAFARKSMLVFYCLNALKNMQVKDIYKDYRSEDKPVKGNKAFVLVAEQLAEFSRANQCPVTLVYIPATDNNHSQQPQLISAVCRKLGLGFADLTKVLTADDYYPLDKHWKPSGHAKAAAYLTPNPSR